jgi:DAK2 domain fusion protein YloV
MVTEVTLYPYGCEESFSEHREHASNEINAEEFKNMVISAGASITSNLQTINDLNVFPVPDGDTGSNMSMTINSAVNDIRSIEAETVGDVAAKTASAMLRGARGNSGVILSLLFRGMSKILKGATVCDAAMWAEALKAGVDAAYGAVSSPAEGTILTVARLSADRALQAAAEFNDFDHVMDAACETAIEALADTINQNPVLKKAGVVDAGGMGWVLALEAMLDALRGNVHELSVDDEDEAEIPATEERLTAGLADFGEFETEDINFAYCTEFIVSRENDNDPSRLRAFLSEIGDSLVVVDDDEIIKVHVHTNDPGIAIQEALRYGSFISVKVENMKLQHSEKIGESNAKAKSPANDAPSNKNTDAYRIAPSASEKKDYGIVAVSPGDGISEVFISLGVDVTVSGGQTMNPSTEDILNAISKINAETVFVLPNNKNIIMAANQAATIASVNTVVIPTASIPEGIAAMQCFDQDLSIEEITEGMSEGAKTADTMQITYAARDSEFDGLHISAGEYLGLYGKKLAGNSSDINTIVAQLADMAAENSKEIITIYYGIDVTEEDAQAIADMFIEKFDEDSVMLIPGGQPVYYYIISAE